MSDKAKKTAIHENKKTDVIDLKNKSENKVTLNHKEILKANGMEEPDIWNLPKE